MISFLLAFPQYPICSEGMICALNSVLYFTTPVSKLRPTVLDSNFIRLFADYVTVSWCCPQIMATMWITGVPGYVSFQTRYIIKSDYGNTGISRDRYFHEMRSVTLLTAWYSSLWDKEHLRCWRQCGRTPNFLFTPWCTPLRRHEYTDIERDGCLLSSMAWKPYVPLDVSMITSSNTTIEPSYPRVTRLNSHTVASNMAAPSYRLKTARSINRCESP
jgi:hypothetical protein